MTAAQGPAEAAPWRSSPGSSSTRSCGWARPGTWKYVAALDAAFFPNESLNRPTNRFGEPSEIPKFNVELVTAATRKNFFQTVGNHSESTARHGILFTSAMAGKEVHGSVTGFLDRDLTAQVRAKAPTSDDDAHIALSRLAREEVVNDIVGVLDAL